MDGHPAPEEQRQDAEASEPYEAPRIVRLGKLSELTHGSDSNKHSDGTFPGSTFL